MKRKDIIDAWARIREIDQTIPDDVLDFMKEAAIEKLNSGDQQRYVFYINDNGDRSVGINPSSHKVTIETDYRFDNDYDTKMFKETFADMFDTRIKAVQTEAEFIKEQKMVADWEKDMDKTEEQVRQELSIDERNRIMEEDEYDDMYPNPPFDQ